MAVDIKKLLASAADPNKFQEAYEETVLGFRDDPEQVSDRSIALDLVNLPTEQRIGVQGLLEGALDLGMAKDDDPVRSLGVEAWGALGQTPGHVASLIGSLAGRQLRAASEAASFIAPDSTVDDFLGSKVEQVDLATGKMGRDIAAFNESIQKANESFWGLGEGYIKARDVDAIRTAQIDKAVEETYERESKENPGILTDLRDIGRQIGASAKDIVSSETGLTKLTGAGIGSIGGSMGVFKALSATGLGSRAAGALSLGVTEGGSQGLEALNNVLIAEDKSLLDTSAEYRDLRKRYSADDAKVILAARVGADVGMTQAAFAVAIGHAVDIGAFYKNPFGTKGGVGAVGAAGTRLQSLLRSPAVTNVFRETVEETLQNVSGEVIENIAQQQRVDPSQRTLEGTGRAGIEGAIGGATAAGSISVPGMLTSGSTAGFRTASEAARSTLNSWFERGKSVIRRNQEEEKEVVAPTIDEVPATQTEAQTIIESPASTNAQQSITNALVLDNDEITALSEGTGIPFSQANTRIDALEFLTETYFENPEQNTNVLGLIGQIMAPVESLTEEDIAEAVSELPENQLEIMNQAITGLVNIKQNQNYKQLVDQITEDVNEGKQVVPEVNEQTSDKDALAAANALAFIAGQEGIEADLSPQVEQVLQHKALQSEAAEPLRSRLTVLVDYLETHKQAALARLSQTEKAGTRAEVSSNIRSVTFSNNTEMKSTLDHLKEITQKLVRGDTRGARDQAENRLRNLAIVLNNKVEALNKSYVEQGKKQTYESFNPNRPDNGFYVADKAHALSYSDHPASVALARQIYNDAKVATEAYNSIIEKLPGKKLEPLSLVLLVEPTTQQAPETEDVTADTPTQNRWGISDDKLNTLVPRIEKYFAKNGKALPVTNFRLSKQSVDALTEAGFITDGLMTKDQFEAWKSKQQIQEEQTELVQQEEPSETPTDEARIKYQTEDIELNLAEDIGDDESIFQYVRRVFTDVASVRKLLGNLRPDQYVNNTLELFRSLIDEPTNKSAFNIENLANRLEEAMAAFIKKNGNRDNMHFWENAHHTIFLNENNEYQREFLEAAVLAGVHWFMNESRKNPNTTELEDAFDYLANELGTDQIDQSLVYALAMNNRGEDVALGIARNLRNFLGIKFGKNVPFALSDGALQGLAADVAQALVDMKYLERVNVPLLDGKRIVVYRQAEFVSEFLDDFQGDKTIFARLMDPGYVPAYVIGNEELPVAKTLNRNNVPLTEKQRTSVENHQKTQYFFDSVGQRMAQDLGVDGYIHLFGSPERNEDNTNINHWRSIQGIRTGIAGAFNAFNEFTTLLSSSEYGLRFQFGVDTNGRTRMLAPYSPQSDKLIRSVLTPILGSFDATDANSKEMRYFFNSVAQALGFDKKDIDTNINEALELIDNDLKDAFTVMREYLQDPDGNATGLAERLKEGFGSFPITHEAITALRELARLTDATPEQLKDFQTTITFETDGKTDGPYNLMNLFGSGQFTAANIRALMMGGMSFGGKTSLYQLMNEMPDLYLSVANKTGESVQRLFEKGQQELNPKDKAVFNGVFHTMNTFLDGFMIKNGEAIVGRLLTKKPVTQKGYAAEINSIVRDLVTGRVGSGFVGIVPQVYMDLSEGTMTVQDKKRLELISSNLIGLTKKGKLFVKEAEASNLTERMLKDPLNFTFTDQELDTIQSNVKLLLGQGLNAAIRENFGEDVLANTETAIVASGLQGMVYRRQFQKELSALVEDLREEGKVPHHHLTQAMVDSVVKKLEPLRQILDIGDQRITVQASEIAPAIFGRTGAKSRQKALKIASGLSDEFSSTLQLRVPAAIGVRYLALLTMGAGDAAMQTGIWNDPDLPVQSLETYDGIYTSVNDLDTMGLLANKHSFNATMQNGLRPVLDGFTRMLAMDDGSMLVDYLTDLQERVWKYSPLGEDEKHLVRSLENLLKEEFIDTDVDTVGTVIRNILVPAVHSIDNRHLAMQNLKAGISVDHMAGANTPYVTNPETQLDDSTRMSPEEAAEALNQEVDKLERPFSGSLEQYLNQAFITSKNTPLLRQIQAVLLTLGSPGDVRVKTNQTIENINRDRVAAGLRPVDVSEDFTGFYSRDNNTIYLGRNLNRQNVSEVVTHEATHSLLTAVLDLATSDPKHVVSKKVQIHVSAIKHLKDVFMKRTKNTKDEGLLHVRQIIEDLEKQGRPTDALGEFISWGLTDEAVAAELGLIEDHSPIYKSARKGFFKRLKTSVKNLFSALFGSNDELAGTALRSLQIHAAALVQAQAEAGLNANPSTVIRSNNELFHQSMNSSKIPPIRNKLLSKLNGYLGVENPDPIRKATAKMKADHILNREAREVVETMSEVFTLSPEEASTAQYVAAAVLAMDSTDSLYAQGFYKAYDDFLNQASPDTFRDIDYGDLNTNEYAAQQEYSFISGKMGTITSRITDRSSLVPAFVALATVSPRFQKILSNLEVPQDVTQERTEFDTKLTNMVNTGLDRLQDKLSGANRTPDLNNTVQNLTEAWLEQSQNDNNLVRQALQAPGQALEAANEFVSKGLDAASRKVSSQVGKDTTVLGRLIHAAGVIADPNNTDQVKEGIYRIINNKDTKEAVSSLVNYVVGRTSITGDVYDMVKKSRALISRNRNHYTKAIPKEIANNFTRTLTPTEQSNLDRALGRVDFASLVQGRTVDAAMGQAFDSTKRRAAIQDADLEIQALVPKGRMKAVQADIESLVAYLATGQTVSGMRMNAFAIANHAFDIDNPKHKELTKAVDELTTLRALDQLPQETLNIVADLYNTERKGVEALVGFLIELNKREEAFAQGYGRMNGRKGYIPTTRSPEGQVVLLEDSQMTEHLVRGYTRIGSYRTNPFDPNRTNKGYYVTKLNQRAMYNQGALQTVRDMYKGVDVSSGISPRDRANSFYMKREEAERLYLKIQNKQVNGESLIPIFNSSGNVIGFTRDINPAIQQKYSDTSKFFDSLGIWIGRQQEQELAASFNEGLAEAIADMYRKQVTLNPSDESQYVTLSRDTSELTDPVLKDAINMISPAAWSMLNHAFDGKPIKIRKDLLDNVIGSRAASVRDFWTGNSRWGKESQKMFRDIVTGVFGNNAYTYLVKGEEMIQGTMSLARDIIVIRSGVVPASNIISNIFQLKGHGVSAESMPHKISEFTNEAHRYTKIEQRIVGIEAKLMGTFDSTVKTRLEAQLRTLKESQKNLKIWPLIANGELSTIADLGLSSEDLDLTSGNLDTYISKLVDKLPLNLQLLARYGVVGKDTALYKGLERATLYGDFVAKAVLYDHLINNKKVSQKDALAFITERFVNYDVQMGRTRGYLENIGATWFSNYKLGSIKVGLEMLQNNPVHTFIASTSLAHTFDTGTPVSDSLTGKIAEGTVMYSVGWNTALRAIGLNPFINLMK